MLDASIAAAWFLPDEQSAASDALLQDLAASVAYVPTLFWFEIRNLLLKAERRGRLGAGESRVCMTKLRSLPFQDEGAGSDDSVLNLAARHSLTAYDASYLALALDRSLALATGDMRLAGAAKAESVGLVGPLASL